ncbi:MAG: class I SAM-dependent methyltransferase [bacterium]
MARRLGWASLSQKRILDFGCGVRFARTIVNLSLDVGLYVGIDVNREVITWLKSNIADDRLKFACLDDCNPMYNPAGNPKEDYSTLRQFAGSEFDAACMFSVITHQRPVEARRIFTALRDIMNGNGQLYFTAFLDPQLTDYDEAAEQVCFNSTYNPAYLAGLLDQCGWQADHLYNRDNFQQFAFVCHPK